MNNYPEYIEVNGKQYKINTDFRVAIRCNEIANDETIGDIERALGIIYVLFGDQALQDSDNYEKLLNLAKKYLSCGKEIEENVDQDPDMDYIQDMDYIETSFMSDYHIDLTNTKMHWWKFFNLMNGLSNSELGNCCVLNRIRNLRTMDTSQITDLNEKNKIIEAKNRVALKKKEKEVRLTIEQQNSVDQFYKQLGF